jgi:hypothetical protein
MITGPLSGVATARKHDASVDASFLNGSEANV